MKLLLLLSFSVVVIVGCSNNTNKLVIKKTQINKEVFYGIVNRLDRTALITKIPLDMEKAFSLVPLKESSADWELRIYFASVWHEIYFVERYQNDSLILEVFNCRGDQKNDSLFMKIQSSIKVSGKYDIDQLPNDDMLPNLKSCLIKDTVEYLDKGYVYFIQTKNGKLIKNILMNDNCEAIKDDKEIAHINTFIQSLSNEWNFSFYDPWDKIDSLAFRNK